MMKKKKSKKTNVHGEILPKNTRIPSKTIVLETSTVLEIPTGEAAVTFFC